MGISALLLIDVQKGFDDPKWGVRNNSQAEANMKKLLEYWRTQSWPVIHIQHCSTEPDSPLRPEVEGNQFKRFAQPAVGEPVFKKTVNSAFIGTELEEYLRAKNIHSLVIVGLTTDHCVSTSTRMAGNLGFNVILVSDAVATFDRTGPDGVYYSAEQIHEIHLASLNGEFCVVKKSEDVI
ncbi:cysteine hydrolase family protein [Oceaniserpentilla sp. 4NH20-0058]|uniref:cysteine hydrolase family protein n=1 Tax=Oceaniserpentilla sp. 4NH20-0058 TaxID=3127660 RepID=UPI00310C38F8